MDIINLSVDWAKGEVFSAKIIAIVSVFVLLCAAGFYFWGKTAIARAYWLPYAVAGVFLVVVAGGLFFANQPRIEKFQEQYRKSPPETFVKTELECTAKSDSDLGLIVYRMLPAIVIACGIGVMLVEGVNWRAWLIVLMMLGVFLMVVDSNTKARNFEYREKLLKIGDRKRF